MKEVRQTRRGLGGANEATYTQDGNDNNIGGRTGQNGANNSLTITQDGNRNAVTETSRYGSTLPPLILFGNESSKIQPGG